MKRLLLIVCAMLATMTTGRAADVTLVGEWDAIDQPGKWIEFRAGGAFDYIYDLGPPRTRLSLQWKTGWFGGLTISGANGQNPRDCKYRIDGDDLTIDDGKGRPCIDSDPVHMAMKFHRSLPGAQRGSGGLHSGGSGK